MQLIVNVDRVALEDHHHGERFAVKTGEIGTALGLSGLGCMLHVVPPGKTAFPFHRHHGSDELFLILAGSGEYRFGDRRLPFRAGDCLGAPAGGEAHQIINTGTEELRYLGFSDNGTADAVEYPELRQGVRPGRRQGHLPYRRDVQAARADDGSRLLGRRRRIKGSLRMLEIKDLHVEVDGKKILNGIDLTVGDGEVHAIMGPNGSGKSTLSYVLAGKDEYEVTGGEVLLNGENLLEMSPDERAVAGVFLAFQYPVEIPGVGTMTFLRTALNAQRKARGEAELTTPAFMKLVKEASAKLQISQDMLRRPLNVGFSGGEKKRNEIFQMALLQPMLCVMDETDSGLDIDALRIVADGVNALRSPERSFVVITHYQRLLNYIVPDFVHVMSKGRIVRSGGKELALELEERGYADYVSEAA